MFKIFTSSFCNVFFYTQDNLPYYIHQAIIKNDLETLKQLCNQGISLKGMHYQGKPLLQLAIDQKEDVSEMSQVIELLIRSGADPKGYSCPDLKNPDKDGIKPHEQGFTPVHKSLLFFVMQNYMDKKRFLFFWQAYKITELIKIFHKNMVEIDECIYPHPQYPLESISLSKLSQLSDCSEVMLQIVKMQPDYFEKENFYEKWASLEKFIFQEIKSNRNNIVLKLLISISKNKFISSKLLHKVIRISDWAEKGEGAYGSYTEEFCKTFKKKINESIDFLLKNGADIDFQDNGWPFPLAYLTPLQRAVALGAEEIATFLIEKGATIGEKKRPKAKFLFGPGVEKNDKIIFLYAKAKARREIFPLLVAKEYSKEPHLLKAVPLDIFKIIYQELVASHVRELGD